MAEENTIVTDVLPWAQPTPEQIAEFKALSPDEQRARVREAIRQGFESGISDMTQEEVWDEAVRRFEAKAKADAPDAV